jgi:hypothetical protein
VLVAPLLLQVGHSIQRVRSVTADQAEKGVWRTDEGVFEWVTWPTTKRPADSQVPVAAEVVHRYSTSAEVSGVHDAWTQLGPALRTAPDVLPD